MFFKSAPYSNEIAALAADNLAIGTLKGEQLTYSKPIIWQNSMDDGSPPCSPQMPSLISGLVSFPLDAAIFIKRPIPFLSKD